MEFASGGLSDGQREAGLAKGGIVSAQTWRTLDTGPDCCYIPMNRTPHSRALLKAVAERRGFNQDSTEGDD